MKLFDLLSKLNPAIDLMDSSNGAIASVETRLDYYNEELAGENGDPQKTYNPEVVVEIVNNGILAIYSARGGHHPWFAEVAGPDGNDPNGVGAAVARRILNLDRSSR